MADVNLAIQYVIGWEDPTLSGKITKDDGGRTRFGIAEKFHPELTNFLFYSSMGSTEALKIAEAIYTLQYCEPLCISLMQNQDVANKLLSLGVNIGVVPTAKMLQDILRVPGDGRIGPITLDALDRENPKTVLQDLKDSSVSYYDALVRENPSLSIYRDGWIRRAEA